jgi:hypothetical protein
MLNTHIKASGPLFNKSITPKKIIQEAIKETADWTQGKLKTESPVRTGKLKSGWTVTPNRSSINVSNSVYYAPYVEKRVRMVAKTIPQVERKLVENVKQATNKLK